MGLSAYDWSMGYDGKIATVNYAKGVRFDKFGLYGYNLDDSIQSTNKSYTFNPIDEGISSA